MIVSQGQLGISLNPFHYAKKGVEAAGHGVATGARYAGRGLKKVALTAVKPFEWLGSKITAPVRNRVHTLRNRRAHKLAFDKRKATTPNAAESAEAKSWTKQHLKSQGPQGKILALFAGSAPDAVLLGAYEPYVNQLGDPATLSVIAASVPVFMALMDRILGHANQSGEAPANPAADAEAAVSAPPGSVDLTPVQDAAADATQAAQDAVDEAGGMVKLPGGIKVKKKHLMIGGAVIGGVVLLSLLLPKKS